MIRHSCAAVAAMGMLLASVSACGRSTSDVVPTTSVAPTTAAATTEPAVEPSTVQHADYEGGATYLTGEIKSFMLAEGTVTTDADGNQRTRDGIMSYRVVSDDPRVAGDVTGTWNTDRWGTSINDGAMIQWGHATLSNEHGTWEAPYEGAFASPYGDIVTRWWTGTGDYDGLTFYMWVAGSSIGVPHFDWHGIIFPGDPPSSASTE